MKRELFAFLGGAAAGAIVALLLAPEKGSVTRRKIKNVIDDNLEAAEDYLKSAKRRISGGCSDLEDDYEHMVDRAEHKLQAVRKTANKAAKEAVSGVAKSIKK